MEWHFRSGGESLNWWFYDVTDQGHQYFVRIQRDSPSKYSWDAYRVTQPTFTEIQNGRRTWQVVSPPRETAPMEFENQASADAWTKAVIEGTIDLPADLSGMCGCSTVDDARSQIEDQIRADILRGSGQR